MTYEELRADALALCADLSATADDGADLDPDSLKERRASEALSVLSGMPSAGATSVPRPIWRPVWSPCTMRPSPRRRRAAAWWPAGPPS